MGRKSKTKKTRTDRVGQQEVRPREPAPSARGLPATPTWVVPALVVAVLVVYLPAIGGGYIWDDDMYVTENPTLRSAGGLADIWFEIGATPQYYPLVHTTFWIEYRLWGDAPLGFHLNNVLLHALGAVLLGLALRRLHVPGAWLAAAIFALHPVHVESVAWITERKNVLSGVLYLAALLAYDRFAGLDRPDTPSRPRWGFYALSLLLFLGALLSKTVTATLPAAIVLLLWWKRKRVSPGDLLPLVPMFVMGIGFGLVTAWVEKSVVGAEGIEWSLTLLDRCLVAGRIVWFYLVKLLWPAPLIFIYPRWTIDAAAPWQYLFPLAALAGLIVLWRMRDRIGKGPLVAALLFGGTLFPALGFIDVYPMRFSFVADHFQYLASIAPIAMAAALFVWAVKDGSPARTIAPAAVLALLGILTWQQAHVYHDVETLWRDTLAKNPTAWIAHNNLGNELKARGESAQAEQSYRSALEHNPEFSDAHNNLATMLTDRGDHAQAVVHFERAIEIGPPRAPFYLNLGNALAAAGRFAESIAPYREALERRPGWPTAQNRLGATLMRLDRVDEAMLLYRETLSVLPGDPEANTYLGIALGVQSRLDEAVVHFDRALETDPDHLEALSAMGIALSSLGLSDGAIESWRRAVAIQPGDVNLRCLLGDELVKAGRADEAIVEYGQALEITPGYERALQGLRSAGATSP